MPKLLTPTQSLKMQTLKDEMPLKGPALTRPQPPPRTTSRAVSRPLKGRR